MSNRPTKSHPCIPATPGPFSLGQALSTEPQVLTGTWDLVPGCPSHPCALPIALHTERILDIQKILFFHSQIMQQQMLPKSTCCSSHLPFRWMPGLQLLQATLGWSCILIQQGPLHPSPMDL